MSETSLQNAYDQIEELELKLVSANEQIRRLEEALEATAKVYVPTSTGIGTVFMNPPVNLSFNLRDYFAAAALQGLMSSQCQVDDPYPIYAYRIADAMLKAKKDKP
jgi:hypothetical protein